MSNSASVVRLLVGFFLTATGVHASCPIELSPPSVVVRYGDSVSVNCSTSEIDHGGMGWEARQGGTGVAPGPHLTWQVDNLTDWTIVPLCFINLPPNRTFDQCQKAANILLYTFPDSISISSSAGTVGVMNENKEYNLFCHIRHVAPLRNVIVTLYKEDTVSFRIISNSSDKEPVSVSVPYTFKATRQDDGVKFRCEAYMDLGPLGPEFNVSSKEYSVTVYYAPSVIVELEDSEVEVGSAVWLKCSSKANPRPIYSWDYYRDSNVVEESDDGASLLLIRNATAHNMGLYTCHATNRFGDVSKTALLTVKGAKQECPIEITPDRMVVPYRGPRPTATCKPKSADASNLKEIFWIVNQDIKSPGESWQPETSEDWDPSPVCTATLWGLGTCQKALNFTLYKNPDSVTILHAQNLSSLVEGTVLKLQCKIVSVAPVQNLAVRWYHGNVLIPQPFAEELIHLKGLHFDPHDDRDSGGPRFPVDVFSTVSIILNRTHQGREFRCEAHLDLGSKEPPAMMSEPLNITVHYKPVINTTKLPDRVPVISGYPAELVCEAEGHPPPKIQWLYSSDRVPHAETLITVSEAGFYNCTATNEVDSVFHVVEVISKEDYLPLIAGFVAVTVVAISIVFVFIYSIYYKNTKMRRYSLKNPKLSTQNSYVAHNGWDLQFPMTNLS